MMRAVSLLLLIFLLYSCQPRYKIEGKMSGFWGKVFLLSPDSLSGVMDTLAMAKIENGKFRLTGRVNVPVFAWLQTEDAKYKFPVFLENTSFLLEADTTDIAGYRLTGGDLQKEYDSYRQVKDLFDRKRDSLKEEYRLAAKKEEYFWRMHVHAQLTNLDSLREKLENKFILEHDNLVAVGILYQRLSELRRKRMLRIKYELLGERAKATSLGKILVGYVNQEVDTRKGALIPDFTLLTPEDKPVSLYSIKAKVKIVDLWASWCGPCRAENPHLRELYEKYHNVGLEIIGVSLDNKKDKWIQAIEKDRLPWIHLSDLKGWDCSVARLLGVHGIPYILVLDENNRILGTKLLGKELDECVVRALQL